MVNSKDYFNLLLRTLCFISFISIVPTANAVDEFCREFNTGSLAIQTTESKLVISDGSIVPALEVFELGERVEADKALAIMRYYGFSKQCFLKDSEPSIGYYRVGRMPPQGAFPGEDCVAMIFPYIGIHPSTSSWAIMSKATDGSDRIKAHMFFGSNESAAQNALSIIQDNFYTLSCFVGRVNPAMTYLRTGPDSDGDGLLDSWETHGFDADGDGQIDVHLPAFGADPQHKDLLLELDWMDGEEPSQAKIREIKQAFAMAPIDAGGTPNPDGLPGINLLIDTGSLIDPLGMEDGSTAGTCSDSIDNDSDGKIDASDEDCLVGDNLGGGNSIPESAISNLNDDFYATKSANFNVKRKLIFRYGLSAKFYPGFTGGWGEKGGNDFIEFNHTSSTIMHELGHLLNLAHGGEDSDNCKPNYVSTMNYSSSGGIFQSDGQRIIDYSPPRTAVGRGQAPLPDLDESNLDESVILDVTDETNQFVFINGNGQRVRNQLNQPVDWNGDGDTDDWSISTNIDTSVIDGDSCINSVSDSVLAGHDDWAAIELNFRQFGFNNGAPINLVTDREPNIQELLALKKELNTTDLEITSIDMVDPVEIGDTLTYRLTVFNNGPNPADQVRVTNTLSTGVTYQSNSAGCVETIEDKLSCDLGVIPALESKTITIAVAVDSILLSSTTALNTITNNAIVENLVGPDRSPDNNESLESTTVKDTTAPVLSIPIDITFEADDECVATGQIGLAIATDIADPNPVVSNDSPGNFQLGENVVTWTATDASGNSSSGMQIVTVIDVTAPVISLIVTPDVLWPPNHKMVNIKPDVTVSDNCSSSTPYLKTITMNESDETDTFEPALDSLVGDGNTDNDIQVDHDGVINLRAERSAKGNGRFYSLIFGVTDGSGNKSEAIGRVKVPHNL